MTAKVNTSEALEKLVSQIAREVNALPYVQTKQRLPKEAKGDEEQVVMLVSDLQLGHKTPTTNMSVIGERMERYVSRALKIVSLHRKVHPVRKLVVFLMGDIVHNERVGKTIDLAELEDVVSSQMFKFAVPILVNALQRLAPHFPKGIDVYCVPGNHGSMGKFHAKSTNMDEVVYRFVHQKLSGWGNIRFHVNYEQFYQIAQVYDWKFFVMHGDKIPMHLNLPWYGITTRMMRLMGSVGAFDYMCAGHFHVPSMLTWGNSEIFINGCFVTDDQWVLANLGMSSTAKQVMFFVHPKQGVSARYLVKLD